MEKQIKIASVLIRATPIMELLTGLMIAGFIYYTGLMVTRGEIEINSFFSFLTAMMLAYQPIRSLATINMLFYQGAAAAERVFGVIDTEVNIKENENLPNLEINPLPLHPGSIPSLIFIDVLCSHPPSGNSFHIQLHKADTSF